jgi:peptidoglycan/xylan/chitin deacetylase (PgdA/CDA1 family)
MKRRPVGFLFALFVVLLIYLLINLSASTDPQSAVHTPMIVLGSIDSINNEPEPTVYTARPIIVLEVDPSKPMVALTFDDGPSIYTPGILDILEQYGCRATFCVIGNLLDKRIETVRRAHELGCEIFGHSWDHRDFTKLKAEAIRQEIRDTSAAIESITGLTPMLYRPPKGAFDDKVKGVSAELGYSLINWSVDSRDWSRKDADKVYTAIMNDVFDRSIILCHDLYASTVEAMERVIPDLLAEGYQLVTVSELMYYSDITLEPGKLYRSGK